MTSASRLGCPVKCRHYTRRLPVSEWLWIRLGVAEAERCDNEFVRRIGTPLELLSLEARVEDPHRWCSGDHFGAIMEDTNGDITGEKHGGVHALSLDGIYWNLATPMKAYSLRVQWPDSSCTVQAWLERLQLLPENGRYGRRARRI